MTTRVIIMEALRIIMAIDSLRHNPANNADNMQACKLVRMNDSVFSATNFVESSDYGWNVQELARQALRSEGSLESRVQVFEKLVIDKLPSVLDEIKVNQPSEYSIHFDNGVVLVAAFVGVVNQKPMLYHRRFLTSSTNSRIEVQKIDRSTDEKPGHDPSGHVAVKREIGREDADTVFLHNGTAFEKWLAHLDTEFLGLIGTGDDATVVIGQNDNGSVFKLGIKNALA